MSKLPPNLPQKSTKQIEADKNDRTMHRVLIDISKATEENLPGIHIRVNDEDIMQIHAIIEGPEGTPYSGGFFYFFIQMPPNYPWSPPNVCIFNCIIHQ